MSSTITSDELNFFISNSLILSKIEADSFLGQEPQRSGSSSGFKPFSGLAASISKSYSLQSLPGGHPEPSLTADFRSHFPSEPQLPAVSKSPIPEFTKSFTGTSHTAKPTPVYADVLNQQYNQTVTTQSYLSPSHNTLLQSSSATKPPTQPPPSSVLFTQQIPSQFSSPSILTPALSPTLSNTSSVQSNQPNQIFSNYSTPVLAPPLSTTTHSVNPISSNLSKPSIFTPIPLVPTSNTPSQIPQHFSTPSILTPDPAPTAFNSYDQLTNTSNQVLPNFSLPSIFTPAPPPVTLYNNSHSTTPEILQPSAPSIQPLFNLFSAQEQSPQHSTTSNFTLPSPPLSSPPSLLTAPTSVALSSSPLTTAVYTPVAPPSQCAPPPSGSQHNSYRLSNIKRPTYTRPPELPVTPMAAMPSTMTPATLPPPEPSSLFTPCTTDSTDSPTPKPVSSSTPTVTTPTYRFPNQSPPTVEPMPSVLPPSFANLAQGNMYRPVYHHWFYKKMVEGKALWNPFSMQDSLALEEAFTSPTISPDTKVPTDGARYDVEVLRRRRTSVYWEEEPGEVRRCSWFVKSSMDIRYVPYEENVSTMLEEEYRIASTTNEWNRQVSLPDGEVIIIHSPNAIAHHARSMSPDVWGNTPQMQQKPRVVKRGMDEFDISDGEPERVDHVLFLVHGIGKFCDLKFRPVTEVVDDFRTVTLQLLQAHFKEAVEAGQVGRVEVLPVSWHQALHSAHIDQRLSNITLQSIPRLRHFTNDTLLDILFYTSPIFCETIVQAVGNELNQLYNMFLTRNPGFSGGVSLGGHSLGSLILFDMLCNQVPQPNPSVDTPSASPSTPNEAEVQEASEEVKSVGCIKDQKARLSRSVSYLTIGTAGTGQPFIHYPQLAFKPRAFFALGSPIGMFVTVRGIESLGEDFCFPTCPMFFNIFHPFDPVAYRIESLVKADFSKYSPVLIPHHKGRKRMHLELKDTLEHVGTALKQRLTESLRSTWNSLYQTMFFKTDDTTIEQEVNKVIEKGIMQASCSEESEKSQTDANNPGPEVKMGQLNGGRRIDYVLQEAPLESFNEYLFALSSHVCYWESEDTMLMMLKEIYAVMGVAPDSQVMQQILPFEMPDGSSSTSQLVALPSAPEGVGMDPTAPMSDNIHVGPPPITGFFRE